MTTAAAALPRHEPLAVATRGETVEGVHYGSIAAVSAAGEVLLEKGDPAFPMFTRSTLKPFQALPFVLGGGPAAFAFSSEQVALLCASHSGEPIHTHAVAEMLAKIGCSERDLQCGTHVPLFYDAQGLRPPPDLALSPLQHNCSGKHAGFLAWCRQHGAPIDTYLEPSHPLQRAIRADVVRVLGCSDADCRLGIDGCGAPNYAVPLRTLAHAYLRFALARGPEPTDTALARLFGAMTAHPEMVSGAGRADLLITSSDPGAIVAKSGAEAIQVVAFREARVAIAIKLAATHTDALRVVIARALERIGLLAAASPVAAWRVAPVKNNAGRQVGVVEAVF
jgi:L-asparaginase II